MLKDTLGKSCPFASIWVPTRIADSEELISLIISSIAPTFFVVSWSTLMIGTFLKFVLKTSSTCSVPVPYIWKLVDLHDGHDSLTL